MQLDCLNNQYHNIINKQAYPSPYQLVIKCIYDNLTNRNKSFLSSRTRRRKINYLKLKSGNEHLMHIHLYKAVVEYIISLNTNTFNIYAVEYLIRLFLFPK